MPLYYDRKALARLPQLRCQVAKQEIVWALALFVATGLLSSCSSVSAANLSPGNSASQSNVRVQISPASTQVSPGGSFQFNATVSGTSSSGVVWSASGGTISSTGLFKAGSSAATVIVTATSMANSAAKASATVALTANAGLTVVSDSLPAAETETPYSASMVASGGTPPYNWSVSSGGLPQGLSLAGTGAITGSAIQSGNFPFTATVTDSTSLSKSVSLSLQVQTSSSLNYTGYDGPAQLPLVYLQTSMADTPAPGAITAVNAGADLQTALNNANCGDTLQLQAGAVFSGKFNLPEKACDDQHWIIVRTSSPDSALPAEGTRLNPCYAGVASLPGRPAFTCPVLKNVMARISYTESGIIGPIVFLSGANHYRFIGLEITRALPTVHIWNLVSASDAADKIIFDRVWIHGTATDETKGGVHLSGMTNTAVVDSYFSDLHCIAVHGSCIDSQDINGGDGTLPGGPYKIDDNFLEASGESIMLGGGPGTTTPADIEIRYNHFFKPLIWQPGAPGFVGGYTGDPFIVKNNLELKNAQRVLLEGNILQNVWGGFTQHGFSILLNPATQNGVCPTCKVTDITIRYDSIYNVGGGFGIGNGKGQTGGYAAGGERYSIHDTLMYNVSKSAYDGYGLFLLMTSPSTTEVLNNLSVRHNTAFPDPATHILSILDPVSQMPGFVFNNNLITSPPFPLVSAGGGSTNCAASEKPLLSVQTCFTGYEFVGNLFVGGLAKFPSNQWPSGQIFVNTVTDVGFVDYTDGNYALASSSPYKGQATDGLDPGADITGLNTALTGVE